MAAIVPPASAHPSAAVSGATLVLPARLDLPAAAPLREAILAHGGAGLRIDAGAVAHLGGLCLQVLLAAAASWRAAGHRLCVTPRSDAFAEALEIFGIAPDQIEVGESLSGQIEPVQTPVQDPASAEPVPLEPAAAGRGVSAGDASIGMLHEGTGLWA